MLWPMLCRFSLKPLIELNSNYKVSKYKAYILDTSDCFTRGCIYIKITNLIFYTFPLSCKLHLEKKILHVLKSKTINISFFYKKNLKGYNNFNLLKFRNFPALKYRLFFFSARKLRNGFFTILLHRALRKSF